MKFFVQKEGRKPQSRLEKWSDHRGEWAVGAGGVGSPRNDTLCGAQQPSAFLPPRVQNPRSRRGLQQPSSCGLLHIPHILYAQLRRNNQGSKQGHGRAASRVRKQPPSVRPAQTSDGGALGGRGKPAARTRVSLCAPQRQESVEEMRRGWDQERRDEKARSEQRADVQPEVRGIRF